MSDSQTYALLVGGEYVSFISMVIIEVFNTQTLDKFESLY